MSPSGEKCRLALLLVLGIGVFYVATIREGHVWGDDHAMYIAHARNIVEGRAYADTGYIRSPSSINPQAYPPGFPMLLALPYLWYGLDLTPMKILGVGFFCVALFLFYLLVRSRNTEAIALLTTAIVGCCPYFWDFKDTVYSDFAFLAFAYGALLAARCVEREWRGVERQVGFGLLAGVLTGLAYATRSVGVVLIPAILVPHVLRSRTVTRFALSMGAAFAGVVLIQKLRFAIDADYLTPYLKTVSVHALLASPLYYLKCFAVPWENGHSSLLQFALYVVLGGLAVVGYVGRIGRNLDLAQGLGRADNDRGRQGLPAETSSQAGESAPTVAPAMLPPQGVLARVAWLLGRVSAVETFAVFYFLFIALFPWGGRRYLMPIMPLFVFYALVGLKTVSERLPRRTGLVLQTGLALAVGLTFVGRYSTLDWRAISGGSQQIEFAELADFIKSHVPDGSAAVFRKARLLALYSRRRVADVCVSNTRQEATDFYRDSRVSHLVVSTCYGDADEASLAHYVQVESDTWRLGFSNRLFTVYYAPVPIESVASAQSPSQPR